MSECHTIAGELCVLRPVGADDVEPLAEIQSEPGVARWWGPPDRADLAQKVESEGRFNSLAIDARGEVVGLIEYAEENEPNFRHAMIDLFVATRHQGRGIGTDAVRTLARYLFAERGHHRLTIDPAVENVTAVHVYEKLGFRRVGVMREYWRSPDGRWRDGLLMDLLEAELA